MKKLFFITSLLGLALESSSQLMNLKINEDQYIRYADGGHVRKTVLFEVEGTSTIPEINCLATLKTKTGKTYTGIRGRIDQVSGKFIFHDGKEEFLTLEPLAIVTFDSCISAFSGAVFKSGFPPIDKQDERQLYRILVDGKASLVKYYRLQWQDIVPFNTTNTTRKFTTVEELYLYYDRRMTKILKNEKEILKVLEVSPEYLKNNKVDIKKEKDLVKLLNYVNAQ